MPDDFLEPPRKLLREYAQHLLLVALDVLFMLGWLGLQALYHIASEWIVGQLGLGPIDKAVKLGFDATFAALTFFWVVRTVWIVHKEAHMRKKGRRRRKQS